MPGEPYRSGECNLWQSACSLAHDALSFSKNLSNHLGSATFFLRIAQITKHIAPKDKISNVSGIQSHLLMLSGIAAQKLSCSPTRSSRPYYPENAKIFANVQSLIGPSISSLIREVADLRFAHFENRAIEIISL
jgi:hypothetical protein